MLASDPKRAEARLAVGDLLLEKGDLQGAEAQYRAVLQQNPQSDVAWNNLGLVLMRTNRVNEAIRALERAVALNPKSPVYLNNLGAAYERAGQRQKARTMYEQALRQDPNFADARQNLERISRR